MSDEPEYEILPPEDEDEVEIEPSAPRSVGFKTLGIATIIAALLGAGGGAAFSLMTEKPTADIAPLLADVTQLETENRSLKTQVTALQRDLKAVPKAKTVDLSGILSRLETLETSAPQNIDPDLVTRLEALKTEGSEALDLSDIYTRLEALENRPAVIEKIETPAAEPLSIAALPEFPKAAILSALETNGADDKSWLKRTLNKHVSVRAEDDPRHLVDGIMIDLRSGNIEAAITKFDQLPPSARTAGKAWRDAANG